MHLGRVYAVRAYPLRFGLLRLPHGFRSFRPFRPDDGGVDVSNAGRIVCQRETLVKHWETLAQLRYA